MIHKLMLFGSGEEGHEALVHIVLVDISDQGGPFW